MSNALKKKRKNKMQPKFFEKSELQAMQKFSQNRTTEAAIVVNVFHVLQDISYAVLHMKFGFAKKRLHRFNASTTEYYKLYENKELSPDELLYFLKEKAGIDMTEESRKVPFTEKVSIAGIPFPKNKNEAIKVGNYINGAYEAWFILACTSLKTLFKFSKKQIEQFIYECNYLVNSFYRGDITTKDIEEMMLDEVGMTFTDD